jgi:hypothetical protein
MYLIYLLLFLNFLHVFKWFLMPFFLNRSLHKWHKTLTCGSVSKHFASWVFNPLIVKYKLHKLHLAFTSPFGWPRSVKRNFCRLLSTFDLFNLFDFSWASLYLFKIVQPFFISESFSLLTEPGFLPFCCFKHIINQCFQ